MMKHEVKGATKAFIWSVLHLPGVGDRVLICINEGASWVRTHSHYKQINYINVLLLYDGELSVL